MVYSNNSVVPLQDIGEGTAYTWIETVGMLLCSASPTLSVAVEELMVVLQGSGISLERVSQWLVQIVLVLQLTSLEVEVPVQSSSIA